MESDNDRESKYMIKKMRSIHCARGPSRCKKCEEMAKEGEKVSLLKVFFGPGYISRPMTEVDIEGKITLCEFDIVKTFKDEKEARLYAKKNKLELLE